MTTYSPDSDVLTGRREERKAHNREKLLLAARRVFATKGLGEATARDIVRQTDLATGTFYNYFDSKEDAFGALLQQLAAKARAAVREQRNRPGATLEERIHDAYYAYFELAVEDAELFAVFRRNAGVIAMMPGEDPFEAGLAELFADLGDWAVAGDLPNVDLGYLATAMIGTGFQLATQLADREPPNVEAAAQFCTRLFMGGIPALPEG
ncbi:MAG TPA: TetR/AcrR family transcriptional regulator [Thermoleophilaceae bacterium]|nr:TetR/AcrR family transcriptional regulator [Thermoleophilaceae bacterium]